ncbi:uncharacterized protein [Halyomorpha halys]|uniref:uncharacterized protein isoform X2 n=1 Tax=Halyomorpha halys TaxID=286706 RepID=UPI0006D4FF42|nr:uncharacterized protein LOC106681811 isoform X2 [Halyomorpha halys]
MSTVFKIIYSGSWCGTYEPFELSRADKKLFRPLHLTSQLLEESDEKDKGQINIEEPDPNYMKSIYRSDYVDDVETLRQMFETKSIVSMEDAEDEGHLSVKSVKPILPLNSSLRVCPGPPRFYKTCKSEYQDTFDMVGRMMVTNLKIALQSKPKTESETNEFSCS